MTATTAPRVGHSILRKRTPSVNQAEGHRLSWAKRKRVKVADHVSIDPRAESRDSGDGVVATQIVDRLEELGLSELAHQVEHLAQENSALRALGTFNGAHLRALGDQLNRLSQENAALRTVLGTYDGVSATQIAATLGEMGAQVKRLFQENAALRNVPAYNIDETSVPGQEGVVMVQRPSAPDISATRGAASSSQQSGLAAMQSAMQQQNAHLVTVKQEKIDAEERLQDLMQCTICMTQPRDVTLFPCAHFKYCHDCVVKHQRTNGNQCPECRTSIETVLKTYQ